MPLAEAGIALYLGYWFRQREKPQATALILIGIPLASVLGAPISGFILDHVHWFSLSSCRWLLILEGLPDTFPLCGADSGEPESLASGLYRFWSGFAAYIFSFWLPQVMKTAFSGQSNTALGFAVMIPHLLGLIAMIPVSRHSDRTRERRQPMSAAGALAGVGMLLLGSPHSPFFSLVLFSAVAIGVYSFLPIFFSLPGEFLTGFSAAAGIALVTSVANLGGFVGPYTVGLIHQKTGSFYPGLICAGVSFPVSACFPSEPCRSLIRYPTTLT